MVRGAAVTALVVTRRHIGGFPPAPLGGPGIDEGARDRTGVLPAVGPPPGGVAAASAAAMSTGATRAASVAVTTAVVVCLLDEESLCKALLIHNTPLLLP